MSARSSAAHPAARTAKLPSSVTASVSGKFDATRPGETFLCTAAASALRFYHVSPSCGSVLRHQLTENLSAPVLQMEAFRREGAQHDSLLLLFDNNHLTAVEYNARTRAVDTVAAFYLGDLRVPPADTSIPPLLRVDPVHRCAAVLVNGRHLHLVPLRFVSTSAVAVAAQTAQAVSVPVADTRGSEAAAKPSAARAADVWGDEDDSENEESGVGNEPSQPDADGAAVSSPGGSGSGSGATGGGLQEFAHPILIDVPEMLTANIRNIRDVCFAIGYDEPTLVFLSETDATWAGRVRILDRQVQGSSRVQSNLLSCVATWVTFDTRLLLEAWARDRSDAEVIDVVKSLRPLIGERVNGLPYTAAQLHPLAPIGEQLPSVLCTSINTILHLNPKNSIAASFNAHGDEEAEQSHNPAILWNRVVWAAGEKPHNDINTVASVAMQLSPTSLLLALESGSVIHIALSASGTAVHDIVVSSLGTASVASSLSLLDDPKDGSSPGGGGPLVFLGSALGDSMVLRLVQRGGHAAGGVPKLRLKLCTSIMNTGPIVSATIADATTSDPWLVARAAAQAARAKDDAGDAADGRSDGEIAAATPAQGNQQQQNPYAQLLRGVAKPVPDEAVSVQNQLVSADLLACVGHGASGALCLMRQTVLPETVIEKSVDAISVFHVPVRSTKKRGRGSDSTGDGTIAEGGDEAERDAAGRARVEPTGSSAVGSSGGDDADFNSMLLFSTLTRTFVVTLGSRVRQLPSTQTALCTTARTVFAAGSVRLGLVVQLTERELFVQQDDAAAQRVALPNDEVAVSATLDVDSAASLHRPPTMLVLTATGKILLLRLADPATPTEIVLNLDAHLHELPVASAVECGEKGVAAFCWEPTCDLLFLVGNNGTLAVFKDVVATSRTDACAIVVARFAALPSTVLDGQFAEPVIPAKLAARGHQLPTITEIACARLSHDVPDDDLTLVVISSTGEFVAYKVSVPTFDMHKVAQQFHDRERVEEDQELMAERQRRLQADRDGGADDTGTDHAQQRRTVRDVTMAARNITARLRVFQDLNGHDGVYVCGQRSFFLFSSRGEIACHEHRAKGATRSFANVDSALVPRGFVLCGEGHVQFGRLNDIFDYRQQWPTSKIPLNSTPHFVSYVHRHRSALVVTSRPTPFRLCRAPFDVKYKTEMDEETGMPRNTGEPIPSEVLMPVDASEDIPIPKNDHCQISLFSVMSWEKEDSILLLENEQVVCVQEVQLSACEDFATFQKKVSAHSPEHHFSTVVAVGTAFPLGEDMPCRGRILLLGVRSDDDGSHRSIHVLHEEGMKAAVTAVTSMNGYLLAAVGPTIKMFYFHWSECKLVLGAFFFAGLYVSKLECCKSYIIVTDAFQSVTMWRYSATDRTVRMLARDLVDMEVVESSVLFNGGTFLIVAADARRNVFFFGYVPTVSGQGKLVEGPLELEADSRLSGCVHWMRRLRVPTLNKKAFTDRSVLMYTTREGEIGFLQAVTEKSHRPLKLLARRLVAEMSHTAALHPAAVRSEAQDGAAAKRLAPLHAIDFDDLARFARLGDTDRRVMAYFAGVDGDRILHNLLRQEMETAVFF